jgi:hypothetical protein
MNLPQVIEQLQKFMRKAATEAALFLDWGRRITLTAHFDIQLLLHHVQLLDFSFHTRT